MTKNKDFAAYSIIIDEGFRQTDQQQANIGKDIGSPGVDEKSIWNKSIEASIQALTKLKR